MYCFAGAFTAGRGAIAGLATGLDTGSSGISGLTPTGFGVAPIGDTRLYGSGDPFSAGDFTGWGGRLIAGL